MIFHHEDTNDCMDAGGTTPRMGEVELRREQQSRAMQEQLPRTRSSTSLLLRALRVFVVLF
jgi:hypothetical protein